MTPRIVFVLKTGGEYRWEHVQALYRNCKKWAPSNTEYHLFTDHKPVAGDSSPFFLHPLLHSLPGWWSKMEMFSLVSDADSPTLFMDLDTVVVGDLWPFFDSIASNPSHLYLLRDFYFSNRLGSGLMGWAGDWTCLLKTFMNHSRSMMVAHHRGGDQSALTALLLTLNKPFRRWQDELAREVISYKVHCRGSGKYPPGAAICCFHGKPRPWAVVDQWVGEARI